MWEEGASEVPFLLLLGGDTAALAVGGPSLCLLQYLVAPVAFGIWVSCCPVQIPASAHPSMTI